MLADYGITSTFFVPGLTADRYPETVERILEAGHEVGHHSYAHFSPVDQTDDEQRRTLEALAKHIKDQDLVITTAQIPGRAAPKLITAEMVASMRPGSVIVDLAAETGGNCEATRAGEIVDRNGVAILGAVNLASSVPYHASLMFSKNVVTLLQHLMKDGAIALSMDDEIAGPMSVVHAGAVRV